MKRLCRLLRISVLLNRIPDLAIIQTMVVALLCFSLKSIVANDYRSITLMIAGLEKPMIQGEVNYLPYARWLALISLPLCSVAAVRGGILKMRLYFLVRIRSRALLWKGACLSVVLSQLAYGILLLLISFAILGGPLGKRELLMVGLISLHTCTISLLALWLTERFSQSAAVISGILMAEGLSYFAGQRSEALLKYMPGSWSMYSLSSRVISDGYSTAAVICFQLMVAVFIIFCTPKQADA